MDDKRIKLITTEMFISWGMICIGFLVVDNIWNIFAPVYSFQPAYTGVAAISKAIIFYSNLMTVFINLFFREMLNFCGIQINDNFIMSLTNVMLILVQFVLYWYFGSLFGRLIVWIKRLRNKSQTQPKE